MQLHKPSLPNSLHFFAHPQQFKDTDKPFPSSTSRKTYPAVPGSQWQQGRQQGSMLLCLLCPTSPAHSLTPCSHSLSHSELSLSTGALALYSMVLVTIEYSGCHFPPTGQLIKTGGEGLQIWIFPAQNPMCLWCFTVIYFFKQL